MRKGEKMPEHQKQLISNSEKGRIGTWEGKKRPPFSIEWCKNISLGHKGIVTWNTGLKTGPLSLGHRKKIGIANSKPKPPFTEEHISNIKKARAKQIMKPHSEESKAKMSAKRSLWVLPMKDSKPERMMQIALALNGIKFEKHKVMKDGKGFYHQVDIFIKPNICVEVDGDYIHGHPDKYHPDDILKKGLSAKEIWAKDIRINHKLNLLGFHVVRIWERDIKSNVQDSLPSIMKLMQTNSEVMA